MDVFKIGRRHNVFYRPFVRPSVRYTIFYKQVKQCCWTVTQLVLEASLWNDQLCGQGVKVKVTGGRSQIWTPGRGIILDPLIIIIIISLIRQVGSNKRKIQIKYKIQNKQTTMKRTEHANIPIKLSKLKKIY